MKLENAKCKVCRQDLFDETAKAFAREHKAPLKTLIYGAMFASAPPTIFTLMFLYKGRVDVAVALLLTVLVVRLTMFVYRLKTTQDQP